MTTLREAVAEDVGALNEMVTAFVQKPCQMTRAQLEAYLTLPDQHVAVSCDDDGKLDGFLEWTVWRPSLSFSGKVCFIQSVYVKEAVRQNGIGGALLDYVKNWARNNGCSVLHLETSSKDALEFYKKRGYTECNSGLYCAVTK